MNEPLCLLRAKECARRLGVSLPTWWKWVKDGKAPGGTEISQGITAWRSDEVTEFINRLVPRQEASHA